MTEANYEGCDCGGEHHTVGTRAWCLDCSEWCYPENICEVQDLRNKMAVAAAILDSKDMMWLMAGGDEQWVQSHLAALLAALLPAWMQWREMTK